jgi:hypothetical protein
VLKVKFILLTTYAIAWFIPSQAADVNPAPPQCNAGTKEDGHQKSSSSIPRVLREINHSSRILLKIPIKFRPEDTISRASLKGLVSLTAHIFIKFPARMLET